LLIEAVLLMTMNTFQEKLDHITATKGKLSRIEQLNSAIDMFLEELNDPLTHGLFLNYGHWPRAMRLLRR
jgi:hypothetical protein